MLDDLIAQLKALPLYGMAQALTDLAADPAAPAQPPTHWVKQLIEAERADRQARTLLYQMKAARFPLHRDLATFDFQESAVSEPRLRALASAEFTRNAHNLIFVGGTGTGKSHLATALGVPPSSTASGCASSMGSIGSISWNGKSNWANPAP